MKFARFLGLAAFTGLISEAHAQDKSPVSFGSNALEWVSTTHSGSQISFDFGLIDGSSRISINLIGDARNDFSLMSALKSCELYVMSVKSNPRDRLLVFAHPAPKPSSPDGKNSGSLRIDVDGKTPQTFQCIMNTPDI